jgi:hypothetical protein
LKPVREAFSFTWGSTIHDDGRAGRSGEAEREARSNDFRKKPLEKVLTKNKSQKILLLGHWKRGGLVKDLRSRSNGEAERQETTVKLGTRAMRNGEAGWKKKMGNRLICGWLKFLGILRLIERKFD